MLYILIFLILLKTVKMEKNIVEVNEESILNFQYYEQMKDSLNCTICSNIIISPLMCNQCETPYCTKCITEWFKLKQTCPMRCDKNQVKIVELNRSLKKIFDGLKLKCKYDCEITLLEYESHTIKCEDSRREIDCFNCGKQCKVSEVKYKDQKYIDSLLDQISKLVEEKEKLKDNSLENSRVGLSRMHMSSVPQRFSQSSISSSLIPSLLDNSLKTLLTSWINTNLEYGLLYKGSVDGFESTSFHLKCDNKGPTLVIMKTSFDKVIGGFTTLNWTTPQNSGIFYKDNSGKSFLFSLTLKEKYNLRSTTNLAICCNGNYGPIFGNYDLLTVSQANQYNCGNYDVGTCYDYNGSKENFYGGVPYKLKEIEVYSVSRRY